MKIFTAYQTGSVTELLRTWIILLVLQITRQGVMKQMLPSRAKTRDGDDKEENRSDMLLSFISACESWNIHGILCVFSGDGFNISLLFQSFKHLISLLDQIM